MAANEKYLTKSDLNNELVWEPGSGEHSAQIKDNDLAANGDYSVAEGCNSSANGDYSHAEGYNTTTSQGANCSHAEGENTVAGNYCSHAEGYDTIASGSESHSEGNGTSAWGDESHSEGFTTTAKGGSSHAEGSSSERASDMGVTSASTSTQIYNIWSDEVEGMNFSIANGAASHVEGCNCLALGAYSHAEGLATVASGDSSHSEGRFTAARNNAEHAEGAYNKSNTGSTTANKTQHSVGIGTSNSDRKNAFEIMQNGDTYVYGVGGYSGTSVGGGVKTLQVVLDEKLSGVTVNQRAATVSGGVASIAVAELPAVTSSDNLKVLQVRNGDWAVVTPLVVYSGTDPIPPVSLGNEGDIYLQTVEMLRAPDIIYETDGTTGLLGHNGSSLDNNWQLQDLNLSGYCHIKCYFACGTATGDTRTPGVVVEIPLDAAAVGPTGYIGSIQVPMPFNRNREYMVSCAVDTTKTKFQVIHQNTLWDISTSDANNNGRYCYKIEGWYC